MTQTLFGASPTVGLPDNAEDTYTMATRITFGVAGTITGIRFWGASNALSSSPEAAVFATTGGAALYSEAFGGGLVTGAWNTKMLTTPQAVGAGVTRDIAVGPLNRYAANLLTFLTPVTSGDLTGTAGRFVANAALTFPSNSSTTWYGVDVLFELAGQEISIGLATELGTALAMTVQKSIELGIATELDTALAMTRGKSVSIGIATELDTALAMTPSGGSAGIASGNDLTATYLANKLAGTIVAGVPTLTMSAALVKWAVENPDISVVEALNREASNVLPNWRALAGVLNQLAGTTDLEPQGSLNELAN